MSKTITQALVHEGICAARRSEHKEKFQQKFIPGPEWAEAESESFAEDDLGLSD